MADALVTGGTKHHSAPVLTSSENAASGSADCLRTADDDAGHGNHVDELSDHLLLQIVNDSALDSSRLSPLEGADRNSRHYLGQDEVSLTEREGKDVVSGLIADLETSEAAASNRAANGIHHKNEGGTPAATAHAEVSDTAARESPYAAAVAGSESTPLRVEKGTEAGTSSVTVVMEQSHSPIVTSNIDKEAQCESGHSALREAKQNTESNASTAKRVVFEPIPGLNTTPLLRSPPDLGQLPKVEQVSSLRQASLSQPPITFSGPGPPTDGSRKQSLGLLSLGRPKQSVAYHGPDERPISEGRTKTHVVTAPHAEARSHSAMGFIEGASCGRPAEVPRKAPPLT